MLQSTNRDAVRILLVEDDEVDVMAVRRALEKTQVDTVLTVANDGVDALAVLRGVDGAEQFRAPYLVLLDLNMPRMGGLEFLDVVRNDSELAGSVIFVHTTSEDQQERQAAYKKNIAGYVLKKDAKGDYLSELVRMLADYWRLVLVPGM